MQHILALSRSAVTIRHWFEINLDDASMEHGVRIEIRELVDHPHRGSESASQLTTVDRPLWRADLFDRLADPAGSFSAAHYHPRFTGNEPSARFWDAALTERAVVHPAADVPRPPNHLRFESWLSPRGNWCRPGAFWSTASRSGSAGCSRSSGCSWPRT